jgi:hypothetical protein
LSLTSKNYYSRAGAAQGRTSRNRPVGTRCEPG